MRKVTRLVLLLLIVIVSLWPMAAGAGEPVVRFLLFEIPT